jgi:voltage-gated potassium channel
MSAPGDTPSKPPLVSVVERMMFGRPLTPKRAARAIASASVMLTVAGGIAARLLDRKEFHSIGDSMWWALQTVTTVGYGDIVPARTSGRIVGAVLMLNGIALLTVITAAVTATLVEQVRSARRPDDVAARLERIEAQLAELTARRGGSTGD